MGDHVLLKVSPTKSVHRFGIKGKLGPHYVGPFEILERIRVVAYRLALPPSLDKIHNVFHVSMFRKCLSDPDQIVELQPLQFEKGHFLRRTPYQDFGCPNKAAKEHDANFFQNPVESALGTRSYMGAAG